VSSDSSLTLSPSVVTFTPDTWNTPRTFSVVPEQTSVISGQQLYTVDVVTTSNDNAYNGQALEFDVIALDDDLEYTSFEPRLGFSGLGYIDITLSEDVTLLGSPFGNGDAGNIMECQFGTHALAFNETRVTAQILSSRRVRCQVPKCVDGSRLVRAACVCECVCSDKNVYFTLLCLCVCVHRESSSRPASAR
jgi:hypothetical protein